MASRSVISIRAVRGTLTWRDHVVATSWSVVVDQSGRVTVRFSSIPLSDSTIFLWDATAARTRFAEWVKIDGVAKDGRKVHSDYVTLNSRTDRLGGKRAPSMKIVGNASRMTVYWLDLPKNNRGLRVSYYPVGMRGYGRQYLRASVGEILVGAPSVGVVHDKLAGQIDVTAAGRPRKVPAWLSSCDDYADRILAMTSLAEGRVIRWSIRNIVSVADDRIIETELYGPKRTTSAHDGLGHYLHLQPWVSLAPKLTKGLRRRTGFDVALEWFLLRPDYFEFQLLAAMTALEHLVAKFASTHSRASLAVSHRTFSAIRRRLDPILAEMRLTRSTPEGAAGLQVVENNIRGANRATFRRRLSAMLHAYEVPVGGLDKRVAGAVGARNVVAHTGVLGSHENYRELYEHVVVLRELLKRIFLALLGYSGRYSSRLNGVEQVDFPPVGHDFREQPQR